MGVNPTAICQLMFLMKGGGFEKGPPWVQAKKNNLRIDFVEQS